MLEFRRRYHLVIVAAMSLLALRSAGDPAADEAFKNAVETPPAGWTGPVFQLSHNYPATKPSPPAGGYPWEAFDFHTKPREYIYALLAYARKDLDSVGWDPTRMANPNWFHAPWMAFGEQSEVGRECFHGMTRERTAPPGELWPGSPRVRNYAVGLYNDVGGWVFGQVWADPGNPNPGKAAFPDGTMAIKLLFTQATADDVPYLAGSLEWDANVFSSSDQKRMPQKPRLLQVDVAARDKRNELTGWVFGTFVYNGNLSEGSSPLDRLAPVGLMWGNDPDVPPSSGGTPPAPLAQTWIDEPTKIATKQHLGCGGRLNGPVDNPVSSCLSCHGTAEWEPAAAMIPADCAAGSEFTKFFRNIPAGTPFDPGRESLDYSLQMAVALRNWNRWNNSQPEAPAGMHSLTAAAPKRAAVAGPVPEISRGE